jgi:uncharacterized protein (DUF1330 family)
MIYITQLIYIKEGEETAFYQFEEIALPLITKYKGDLLLRVRPTADAFIEGSLEPPFEIHLVSFPSENDLRHFMQDEERKQFLHLKEQSIKTVLLLKGSPLV